MDRKYLFTAMRALTIATLATIVLGGSARAKVNTSESIVGSTLDADGLASVPGSNVSIRDFLGTLRTVPVAKGGTYSAKTTGLTAPFLIWNDSGLFSYSLAQSGTANINGFTDLAVNQIYQAQGTSALAQSQAANPMAITFAQLNSGIGIVRESFRFPFDNAKIPFDVDFFEDKLSSRSPLVKLLGRTSFSGLGSNVESAETQFNKVDVNVNFTAMTNPVGTLALLNAQGPAGAASASKFYAMYPPASAESSYDGVVANLALLNDILHHEKSLLDALNLLPVFSQDYLNNGKTVDIKTGFMATELRKVTVISIFPASVIAFHPGEPDSNHNLISVNYGMIKKIGGATLLFDDCGNYICDLSGNCLLYGNQKPASTRIRTVWETFSSGPTPSSSGLLNAILGAPTETITSGKVSDSMNQFFNNDSLQFIGTRQLQYQPFHKGPVLNYALDSFGTNATFSPPFPFKDMFDFTYSGSSVTGSSVERVRGYTIEDFHLTKPSLSGSHDLSDLKLGKPFTPTWTLPLSYEQERVNVRMTLCGSGGSQTIMPKSRLKPNAVSAALKLPSKVGGSPITGATLTIDSEGTGGERSQLKYDWSGGCQVM